MPVGKIVYTQFLNSSAGIEADVTVTRIEPNCYLVVTPPQRALQTKRGCAVIAAISTWVITDVTSGEGVLAIMGPRSRELLQTVSPNDFTNDVNPFGTAQDIEIGMGLARVHRVTYVGELGGKSTSLPICAATCLKRWRMRVSTLGCACAGCT